MDSQDLDTVAALRSRVEQQSTLIAMLKQRGDSTLAELTESMTKCKVLAAQVDTLQGRLSQEEGQYKQLEHRFSILAKNHEEMIRIKDEYKQANIHLQAQHKAHLSQECMNCTKLQDELADSKMTLSKCEEMSVSLVSEHSDLQAKVALLEKELELKNKALQEQRKQLTHKLNGWEDQMCRLELQNKKGEEENEQLKVYIQQLELDKENITQELTSHQNLLLECQLNLQASQDREHALEDKFRLCSEQVSRDACVKKLRKELLEAEEKLSAIEKDYSAYKKHSSQLLAQERELNNKLRHFLN